MLKINDKYYLDSDRFQFIVREKYIGTDGKRKGEEVFKDVAFCGNLFQVKDWIMQNEIRSDLTLLENIDKAIELSHTIDKTLMGVGKK